MMFDTNIYFLLIVWTVLLIDCTRPKYTQQKNWEPFAVSYERIENIKGVSQKYKLLIVEPDNYTKIEIDSLNNTESKLIAYISLGEVDRNRWYYPLLEEQGFLGVNENWDSPYLNLADSTTRSILLDKVVPDIMSKGFDGLFLDTVDDVAPYTDRADLQPYMIDIIAQIHSAYPNAVIIQNAGLFLLEDTKRYIDAVLIEDVATLYNFENESYNLRPDPHYKDRIKVIEKYSALSEKPFLILDFADDKSLIDLVTRKLDKLPYAYFISSIELNNLAKGFSSGYHNNQ